MKFKHRATGKSSVELQSTRTVTLFCSPEFGHMIVDGKCADSNVIDRGKVIMEVELSYYHNVQHQNIMHYHDGDFKCTPDVFVSRAVFRIHDTEIATYTKGYRPSQFVGQQSTYVYDVVIPVEFRHVTDILKTQVVALVHSVEP